MKQLKVSPARQRGSIYTAMIMVALLGFVLLAALKVAPAYLDNNVITNTMDGIRSNNDIAAMSIGDIRTSLMRTLNTNRIEGFDASNVVVAREGAEEYIDINYETRVTLFYNIDAIVKFENRFPKF
jgi:hypothetical protein